MLFVVHPGFEILWGQSYWGGAVAMLGGSLVLGATPRQGRQPRCRDAVAMASGAVLLAISRPYEGVILCLLAGVYVLAKWLWHHRPTWQAIGWRVVLPQTLVFVAGGVALAHYHHCVTGDSFTFPYQIHESNYARSPNFLWQPATMDHDYNHPVMAKFHRQWALDWYRQQQTLAGWLRTKWNATRVAAHVFFPLPLALPLVLSLVLLRRGQRMVAVVGIVATAWLASMVTVWSLPHYMAPLASYLLLLVVWGLRHVKILGNRWFGNQHFVTALVLFQTVYFVVLVTAFINTPRDTWQWRRAAILRQFEASPDRHLVFVHYDPDHNPHHEWVYNRADIDRSKVVWARELGRERERELLDYFPDRKAWRLQADAPQPHPQPIARHAD
jgi:hypothetical protein